MAGRLAGKVALIMGGTNGACRPIDKTIYREAVANPEAIDWYQACARSFTKEGETQ